MSTIASFFCLFSCSTPRGLEDVSKYPNLFTKLMEDAKWSADDLKKLAGLNFLRVLRQVEQVSIVGFNFKRNKISSVTFSILGNFLLDLGSVMQLY